MTRLSKLKLVTNISPFIVQAILYWLFDTNRFSVFEISEISVNSVRARMKLPPKRNIDAG